MTEEEKKAKIKQIVSEMADDIRDDVREIEETDCLTQYHYGAYYNVLSKFESKNERLICAMALIEAGANKEGVRWAMRLVS